MENEESHGRFHHLCGDHNSGHSFAETSCGLRYSGDGVVGIWATIRGIFLTMDPNRGMVGMMMSHQRRRTERCKSLTRATSANGEMENETPTK
jgi:hypothetical protein